MYPSIGKIEGLNVLALEACAKVVSLASLLLFLTCSELKFFLPRVYEINNFSLLKFSVCSIVPRSLKISCRCVLYQYGMAHMLKSS